MKYLVVVLLFVVLASCLGSIGTNDLSNATSASDVNTGAISQSESFGIQDEYWPFEETVQRFDPSLLEVSQKLEAEN